jgi:hypothetical protein
MDRYGSGRNHERSKEMKTAIIALAFVGTLAAPAHAGSSQLWSDSSGYTWGSMNGHRFHGWTEPDGYTSGNVDGHSFHGWAEPDGYTHGSIENDDDE